MPTISGLGKEWKTFFWPDLNFQHLLDIALKEHTIEHFQCKLLAEFPDKFEAATGYVTDRSSAHYTAYLYLCAFRTYGAEPVQGQSDYNEMSDILNKLADELSQFASQMSSLHPNLALYTVRDDVHLMLKEYVDSLYNLGFSFKYVF